MLDSVVLGQSGLVQLDQVPFHCVELRQSSRVPSDYVALRFVQFWQLHQLVLFCCGRHVRSGQVALCFVRFCLVLFG